MTEIPKEVEEFLDMVRMAELLELRDSISQRRTFLAKSVELKLFTINKVSNNVLMTFEAHFDGSPRLEVLIRDYLNSLVGKRALVVI